MEANITYMYMYRKFAILSNRQKMGHFGKSGISAIFLEQTSDLHHSTKKDFYPPHPPYKNVQNYFILSMQN